MDVCKNMKYNFIRINACNMCSSSINEFKIIGKRLNMSQGINPRKKIGITTTICKCKNCGLIFSNPLPIPENIEMHYGIPPESYWISNYFRLDDNYFKTQIDTFKNLYKKNNRNIKALDIGAGIGKCMLSLERNNITAFGIEPSTSFYDKALSVMKINSDRLFNIDIENASFDNEQFDFITFGAVLEHLYNPSDSIVKALEWLKPNGLIHIEVPSSEWLTNKIVNLVYKLKGLDYVANISPMHSPFHLYEFNLKSFNEHSKRYNYEIVFYKYMVTKTYLPKIFNSLIEPIMRKTNTGMQLEVWLRKIND